MAEAAAPSAGASESPQMPVKDAKKDKETEKQKAKEQTASPGKDATSPGSPARRRKQPPSPARREFSWEELQGITSRAASAIDRVEYLASSQVKFTEFKISEAHNQGRILRQCSQPTVRFDKTLGLSKASAVRVFDKQRDTVTEHKTTTKRLEAFSKYVVDQEKRSGTQQGEACKKALKGAKVTERPYPVYQDLFELRQSDESGRRLDPLMAFTVPLPYSPPEEALRHGAPKPKSLSTTF